MTQSSAAARNVSKHGAVWILGPVAEDDGALVFTTPRKIQDSNAIVILGHRPEDPVGNERGGWQ